MIAFLRFVGVVNAAIWLGGAVFFTFGAAPAVFSKPVKELGQAVPGIVAQMVLERYFVLQYWCGAIAIVHYLAEWLYLGKAWQRLTFSLILCLFALGLTGGLWLQPKLKRLHEIKYGRNDLFDAGQKAQATKAFASWHGVSQVMNILVLSGLAFYLYRITAANNGTRFVPTSKFRS